METSKLETIFSDALINVVTTVSGFALEVIPRENSTDIDEIAGVMCLSSKKQGLLIVSAKENDARLLCSYMIGVFPEEVTADDIEDAMCEIANMTAGNAKLRLSDTDFAFTLSSPFALKGQNMALTVKSKTFLLSKKLCNDEISLNLKFVY